jgi:hypothetical protein
MQYVKSISCMGTFFISQILAIWLYTVRVGLQTWSCGTWYVHGVKLKRQYANPYWLWVRYFLPRFQIQTRLYDVPWCLQSSRIWSISNQHKAAGTTSRVVLYTLIKY